MKITKKIETEILQVIDNYWDSYFQGDLQSWAAYLPEDYRNIGTTKAEIWNSKKEIVDFTESIIDQTVGMAEVRDKKTQIIPYDPYVMVHELGDLYVKAEEGWVFYAQFRLSSLLGKTKDGWKILHQHGSYPDSKTDEGEAFGFDELKAENKKLRDAIRARTIDLERKNRELEIESSLERVRAVAMSMKNSKELQAVSEVIFKELIALGCSDLRNAEIIINQDEKQSILSYYYSDYGVSGEIEVDYTSHPVLKKWADDMKTAGDGFAGVHISEEEMEGWKQYRLDLGYLPDPKLENAKTLDYYSYSTGLGALSISSFKPISEEQVALLERFRNVFGLAYRRYADVVQAEAQAREAEIEAALERVRAKGLAMHHTDELEDIVHIVFEQLLKLAIPIGFSSIGINEYDSKELNIWIAAGDNIYTRKLHVPFIDHPIHTKILEALTNGVTFLSNIYSLEEMRGYYEHIFRHPEYRGFPEERKQLILSSRGYSRSAAISKYTTLAIGNYRAYTYSKEENEILKRFAKVFEQTYTRFLDLQKAEAQAREAQIEAALERVRSRSMAMHKSEELNEVVSELYKQMKSLEFSDYGCTIIICKAESKTLEHWYAGEDQVLSGQCYNVPLTDQPVSQKQWSSWLAGVPEFKIYLSGQEKADYTEFMLTKTDHKYFSDDVKEEWRAPDEIYFYYARLKFGLLEFVNIEPFDEVNFPVYQRFATVFEQTYTRFLDLQKAEAQAREAQIEAALERVRSRTMAMHQSKELTEVVSVMYENMESLGLAKWGVNIMICHEDSEEFEFWLAEETASKHTDNYFVKGREHPVYRKIWDHWEAKGAPLTLHHQDEYKREFDEYWLNKTDFKNLPDEVKASVFGKNEVFLNYATMRHGLLNAISYEQPSNELIEGLDRFAKVFEQAYTRFLDIQKAEAQAREAQIEAALERVRARTMAMHHTDELADATNVLFNEMRELGLDAISGFISLVNVDENSMEIWLRHGELMGKPTKVYGKDYPSFQNEIDAWKKQKPYLKTSFLKQDFINQVASVFNGKVKDRKDKSHFHLLHVRHKFGFLGLGSWNETSDNEIKLYSRFTNVFEQTYTRFLDLQKAEAQAREAQIEAALERVRARAMAMHVSSELSEVVAYLYRELDQFGMGDWGCNIMIFNEEKDQIEIWLAESDQRVFDDSFKFRAKGHTFIAQQWEIWRKQKDENVALSGKVKRSYDDYILKNTDFKNLPVEIKAQIRSLEEVHFSFATMQYGMLAVIDSNKGLSDSEKAILKRFAKVFQQTYTRFLDLQKAEAQAREAQIEAALEKVRSRSLAVNKSDEFNEVVGVVFEKLSELDMPVGSVTIALTTKGTKDWEVYGCGEGESGLALIKFTLPYFPNAFSDDILAAQSSSDSGYFSKVYSEAEKNEYYEFAFKNTELKNLPDDLKQRVWQSTSYGLSVACTKNSILMVNEFEGKVLDDDQANILKRFSKVFEQAYIRFLDLQRAEAQAREAQIEAALERVRSRSMAMHKSEELSDVANVLFEQLRNLGGNLWGTGFAFCQTNSDQDEFWFVNQGGTLPTVYIPNNEDPIHRKMYEGWKDKLDLYSEAKGGAELKAHYEYMLSVPSVKGFFQGMLDSGLSFPEWQKWHAAYFSHGYLLIITVEPYKEEQVFTRFAKVFDQAYTRFLDLQRAEAQAREAQIEAALERLRAKAMSMHHSDELDEVLAVLCEQFDVLGIVPMSTHLTVLDIENNKFTFRETGKYGNRSFGEQTVALDAMDTWKEMVESWHKAEPFSINRLHFPKETLPQVWEVFHESFASMPEDSRITPEDYPDGIYHTAGKHPFGYIGMNQIRKATEEEEQIVVKFANEFGRAYQRFLDLQKAEEQAREAQIEAALERVRSRSMAMHESDELRHVIATIFNALQVLGFDSSASLLGIYNDDLSSEHWIAGFSHEELPNSYHIPYCELPYYTEEIGGWQQGLPFKELIFEGDPKIDYAEWLLKNSDYKLLPQEFKKEMLSQKRLYISNAHMKYGLMEVWGEEPLDALSIDILKRFAKVFEQTYTRFLDLQKAEAQAREAQIEVALERVRARTMAMHHSHELAGVMQSTITQLKGLDIKMDVCAINLLSDTKDWHIWVASPEQNYAQEVHIPFFKHQLFLKSIEARKNKGQVASIELNSNQLTRWYEHIFNHSAFGKLTNKRRKKVLLGAESMVMTIAMGDYSFLLVGKLNSTKFLNEDLNIFKRFSQVFDQAYTRFLDLKKAESQAREAEIEAALERVRSATMAMHNSEDVGKSIVKMFEELTALGVPESTRFGIGILNQENTNNQLWTAKKIGEEVSMHIGNLDMTLHPLLESARKAWEKQVPLHKYVLEGEDLLNYYRMLNEAPDYKIQIAIEELPEREFHYGFIFEHGFFYAFSPHEFETELIRITQRFSALFAQTYRRYLDLVKAEAQAREAKIEAGLERVRAASMAMHKSEDLHKVINLVYSQLVDLGLTLQSTQILDNLNDKHVAHFWLSNNVQEYSEQLHVPITKNVFFTRLLSAIKNNESFFTQILSKRQKDDLSKLVFENAKKEDAPKSRQDFIYSMPGLAISAAIGKAAMLTVMRLDAIPYLPAENEIIKRFGKVFDQSYTRFLDLQKAEAQAREAEIELALERVRAKTMAMHNSDELLETGAILFKELSKLGVKIFNCGYVLVEDEAKIGWNYGVNPGDGTIRALPTGIPQSGTKVLDTITECWKKQEPLLVIELDPQETIEHQTYIAENAANFPLTKEQLLALTPERLVIQTFNFKQGYLLLVDGVKLTTDQQEMVTRFANVFEMTYRRFLDLQKAEAQAREAQIEAALERVRARSMGMHKTEELSEVVALIFEEIKPFGFATAGIELILVDEKKEQLQFWMSGPAKNKVVECFNITPSVHSFFQKQWKAWEDQVPRLTLTLEGKEKKAFDQLIFTQTDFKYLSNDVKEFILNHGNIDVFSHVFMKYGYLEAVDKLPLSEEMFVILERFAKVFEQTYTRFLDLQKAEAQAREAQIEVAVERVRAEAMAMHSSEDFNQTAAVLWEQVNKLEVTGFAGAGIALFGEDGYITWYDFSSPGNIGSHEGNVNRYEYSKYPLLGKEVREVYQQGEPYFVFEYDLPKLEAAVKEWELIKPSVAEGFKAAIDSGQLTQQWSACGRITNGFLFFDQLLPPDEDSRNILLKMTGAFELAYQRFLDLQKAEAQAREKEIQLGLEKVRARAMAMRHSDELADLVKAVFDELTKLDFAMQWCMINIIDEATRDNTIWAVNPDVDKAPQSYDIRFGDWPYHQASFKAYQERKTKFVYVLEGKEKTEFEEFMFNETDVANISEEAKAATRAMERYVHSYSFSDFGGLQTVSETPLSEESLDILARFGKVFDLTYTRFNDLKKAEAQAREAQIEASLERIRARTMAMHKSEELNEVAAVLYEQFSNLTGIFGIELGLFDDANNTIKFVRSNVVTSAYPKSYFVRGKGHPVLKRYWKIWQDQSPNAVITLKGKKQKHFLNFLLTESDFKDLPAADKKRMEVPVVHLHFSPMQYGFLKGTTIDSVFSNEDFDIFNRFAKVFEQTYTRFLDLQKAEARTREAQIEAAMERVRARAMAMQKAEELVDVATLLRKEMGLLGIEELETSSIYIHNKATGKTECWFAIQDNEKEENLISDHMVIDLNDTWVGRQMLQFYQSDETKASILMQGSNRTEWINYCAEHSDLFSVAEFYGAEVPERTYHLYKFSNGYMGAASPGEISTESWNLLQRATKVFSLAYTRFSDLQMAETQAREAQIELALERGRTQSMLMQHSDELNEVSNVFHEQLLLLGLPSEFSYVWLPDEKKMTHMFWATWSEKKNGAVSSRSKAYTYPLDKTEPYTAACYEMWESEESVFVNRIQPDEVEDFFSTWAELVSEAETLKAELFPNGLYYAEAYMKYGCFGINIRRPLSKEEQDILLRFSVEFERAYTRFLDLKKAEAQTREAQIEASLERVRAQTMAMHDSEDVGQCIVKLFSELITLGVSENTRLGIGILNHDNENMELWTASKDDDTQVKLDSGSIDMSRHPLLVSARNAWKENRRVDQYIIDGKEQVKAYFQIINTMPDYPLSVNMEKVPNRFVHYDFVFEQGILYAFSPEELSEEMIRIFQRFSALFGQTYRRFLDLQKAEAQAREAKIEAALERVRSRTMAMHKADELHEVVTVVVEKLVDLGVVLDANGVILCTYFQDSRDVLHWIASPDFSFSGSYLLPYFDHPIFSAAWESKLNGDDYFSQSFTVEEKNTFFEYAFEHSDYKHFPEEFKEWVFQNDKHSLSFAWSEHSAILIPSHTGVLPSDEDAEVLKRFAKVFEQAYVRFMDLQKAEKQAKEALKQAALDRVRGEIASMRSTEDLNRITPVIWRELIALDVPFIRCGVFIVNEEAEMVEVYLTTPEGAALGVLNLPFDINSQTTNTVKFWREKMVYREHWDAQAFTDWTKSMIDLGQVKEFADYQGASKIPDALHLHFIPFKQGMLYVGDVNPLPDEKIEMVKTLAEAFSIAYARYEDFVRLEQAKSAVEVTLEELKSTQAQLIQSEKMASLGELTAGIAHEIQNPLNFVNNFSEVSDEILDEMIEELENGDLEEVKAIASDIKQNLQKINHHGKRADAIVKGMLQHSRQSSGEKTPTDINQLADEYLRLAYHGLRAKDKSFNAAFETEFDPNLPMVKVIPQDIGRVLLNLINNAFQAVQEKSQSAVGHYAPKVSVQTSGASDAKSGSEEVIIKIRDNGPGIPDHIRDKIFQPFFTTKPTGQGTGLGLSLSYDIIKAHSGEIRVFSEEGKGTEFQISLPID